MKKHGEDRPEKAVPDQKDLQRMANTHPAADIDTRYQDNQGKKDAVKKGPVKTKMREDKDKI